MSLIRRFRVVLAGAVALTAMGVSPVPVAAGQTLIVNRIGDEIDATFVDGFCDIDLDVPGHQCTLRAAITEANLDADRDIVHFNIAGQGVKTITLGDQLPGVEEPLTIDGYTQTGARPNGLLVGSDAVIRIRILGSAVPGWINPVITGGAPVTLRGLALSSGIDVDADGVIVRGCFIGVTPSGVAESVSHLGVVITGDDARVGGRQRADRNVIYAPHPGAVAEIEIHGDGGITRGNVIGLSPDLADDLVKVGPAIWVDGAHHVIGGDERSAANLVVNHATAIVILGGIGTTIARNEIRQNETGIDLGNDGPTPNDGVPDADTGPNGLQNFPVIESAVTDGDGTTIDGVLRSKLRRTYDVRFFSNTDGEAEGHWYLGKIAVTTGPGGVAHWSYERDGTVPVGRTVTATATDTTTGSTSEFSAGFDVTAP